MATYRHSVVALTAMALSLALSLALPAAIAAAQQVGTATAVNPTSESTAPGGATNALQVGAHIVHKERIKTTPSGSVHLLFLDQSSMSIAPNTDIVIDEFVYDPKANSGHTLTTLTQGALRFVGGKLSHQGESTITTSSASIGIRGGTVTVAITPNGTRVINHYGVVTVQNGAGTMVLKRPDFASTIANWNSPPGLAERVSEDEIVHYQKITVSQKYQDGGVPGLKHVRVIDHVRPPSVIDNGETDAFQIINQAADRSTFTTPLPRRRGN
jgi:FecR protein